MILNLYDTNQNPRIRVNLAVLRLDRFQDRNGGAFNVILQGGGDHATDHQCPGK